MMRFLGYLFLLLLVVAAALAGAYYYLDRQASAFVVQSVRPIYSTWDFAAMKRRASAQLFDAPEHDRSGRKMFEMFSRALGPLQSVAMPKGGPEYGWKSDAEIRGVYASYSVQAEFERGEARLLFVVAREGGLWRIVGFRVDGPASVEAVGSALEKRGPDAAFKPGNPEETATMTATARQIIACLDSDAVGKCWDGASPNLKQAVGKQEFVSGIATARTRWGVLQKREVRAVEFSLDVPRFPRGQFARATFDSTFSRERVEERLLFYNQDGVWLLIGYRWIEPRGHEAT
jgi:hypothetical protein